MTDEYIRREDELFALRKAERGASMTALTRLERAYAEIREMPAADVAQVVLCKDCKNGELYARIDGETGVSNSIFQYANEHTFTPVRDKDDFCSYGAAE